MKTLYGSASNGIDLLAALEQCGGVLFQPLAVALLYTPGWCGFAQVRPVASGVELILPVLEERRFDPATVFEARIFGQQAELRWLKQWPNKGRAVLLAEEDVSSYLDDELMPIQSIDIIDQTYLLWGEGVPANPRELPRNWSRLAMARIGTLDVPYPLDDRPAVSEKDQRIHLIAREYVDVDEHGNAAVVEERLMKLARA
jgi:CRISPR-associated protein (TIGR03984 family)